MGTRTSGDPTAGRVTGPPGTAPAVAPGTTGTVDLDGRPYELHVPAGHDPAEPVPLVVGLHRYASSAAELDSYLGLTAAADERGFLLALPEGTQGRGRMRFWNATPVCCNFERADVDDSGYLSRLVEQVAAAYPVSRAVVVGHSNGGYMAHRLACEHAGQFSAIASLAGLPRTTASWARSTAARTGPTARHGRSTSRGRPRRRDRGHRVPLPRRCARRTVEGGAHIPELTPAFAPAVLDLLLG